MLYVSTTCSNSLNSGTNHNIFNLSGELIPKQQIPIGSDTVTGYIGANGNTQITLQVSRSVGQSMNCCTCFYIQFSISQTLFESEQGTKGAITLSDSAANYDYLEFFWKHDDGACGSQRIADPNGKTIGINATSSTSYGYLWFAYKGMNISGTQCTLNTDHAVGELGFTNDGTMERRKQDKLGITKVIGYKLS